MELLVQQVVDQIHSVYKIVFLHIVVWVVGDVGLLHDNTVGCAVIEAEQEVVLLQILCIYGLLEAIEVEKAGRVEKLIVGHRGVEEVEVRQIVEYCNLGQGPVHRIRIQHIRALPDLPLLVEQPHAVSFLAQGYAVVAVDYSFVSL